MESNYRITRLTPEDVPAIHTYFDLFPESPDETRIVYYRFFDRPPGPGQVVVASRDGNVLCAIDVPWGSAHTAVEQQWVDDDHIAYRLFDPTGSETVVHSLADGSSRRLPGLVRMFSPVNGTGLSASTNTVDLTAPPTEKSVSLTDFMTGDMRRLFTDADILAIHPLGGTFTGEEEMIFKHTKWAPDGKVFFFVFANEPHHRLTGKGAPIKSVFVANADGSGVRYLTEFGHHPGWDPGSAFIYSWDRLPGGGQALAVHPRDGSPSDRVLACGPGVHSSLNPDGRRLVTDAPNWPERGRGALLMYTDGGPHEILATFKTPDTSHETGCHPHPIWSRNGTRVYFNASEAGIAHLYALDF